MHFFWFKLRTQDPQQQSMTSFQSDPFTISVLSVSTKIEIFAVHAMSSFVVLKAIDEAFGVRTALVGD